jgi:hypothetical protein
MRLADAETVRPRLEATRIARGRNRVDETDRRAVQQSQVRRLGELGVKPLEIGTQGAAKVETLQDGECDSGQSRTRAMGPVALVLPHETLVLQHRQQPVRRRGGHPEVLAASVRRSSSRVPSSRSTLSALSTDSIGYCGTRTSSGRAWSAACSFTALLFTGVRGRAR